MDYSNYTLQQIPEYCKETYSVENGYIPFYVDFGSSGDNPYGYPILNILFISVFRFQQGDLFSQTIIDDCEDRKGKQLLIDINANLNESNIYLQKILTEKKCVVIRISDLDDYEEYLYVPINKYKSILRDMQNQKMSNSEYTTFLNSFEKALIYY